MGFIERSIKNGLDDFRDSEVVAHEKAYAKANSVATRMIDSTLDMAGQLLVVSDLSMLMQHNNRTNDAQLRNDSVCRADVLREIDRESKGRRSDLEYRTEACKNRVASPSSPEYQSSF